MPDRRLPHHSQRTLSESSELELHSPEELLYFADQMLKTRDPNLMRAVVMESITALEAFVQKTVFAVLKGTMDPLLVKWMEEKTKMDFDSRLKILTPVALGRPIDVQGQLWSRYVDAKRIRNSVSHSGRRINYKRAKRVYDTAYDWLAYLGSTVEVDMALLRLKRRVETGGIRIVDERTAEVAVNRFFSSKKSMSVISQPLISNRSRPDILLKYGLHTVLVELKFVSGAIGRTEELIIHAITQTERLLVESEITRGALVVFTKQSIPHPWGGLRKVLDGRISVIGILVPSEVTSKESPY